MDLLEQLKEEGILDLISQLGELTDEELELLIKDLDRTQIGVA
tara:strand:- start:10888 stop:11016 length:129 start_codon:yes stop_codon:yes gene_type:complete